MPLSAAAEFEEARRMVNRIELSNSHVKQHERALYYTPLHVGSMTNAPLCKTPPCFCALCGIPASLLIV